MRLGQIFCCHWWSRLPPVPNKGITWGLFGPWGVGLLHIAAAATLPRKREERLPAKPLHRPLRKAWQGVCGPYGKGPEDGLEYDWELPSVQFFGQGGALCVAAEKKLLLCLEGECPPRSWRKNLLFCWERQGPPRPWRRKPCLDQRDAGGVNHSLRLASLFRCQPPTRPCLTQTGAGGS